MGNAAPRTSHSTPTPTWSTRIVTCAKKVRRDITTRTSNTSQTSDTRHAPPFRISSFTTPLRIVQRRPDCQTPNARRLVRRGVLLGAPVRVCDAGAQLDRPLQPQQRLRQLHC